ncbi:class I SAM-dependent methyltransferase [Patescibacteria group bacterium]|nr:class I SAM-dependent methyltransferase [Patescibacteria group bacterium]
MHDAHEVVWDKKKVSEYWDIFGNITPVSPWFSVKASGWLLKEINKIIKDIHQPKEEIRILDMGCGSGEFIDFLRLNTGCKCYGVDISEERVEISRSKFPDVDFSVGSLESTNFKDGEFDVIISTQAIEHLFDDELKTTFDEMHRLLTKKGRVLLTTRFEEDLTTRKRVCPDCHAIFLHSQHMQSFSVSGLSLLLRNSGLETIVSKRSRCRDHVNEFVPRRFKFINRVIYKIFGNYLDKKVGIYLYSISKKIKFG